MKVIRAAHSLTARFLVLAVAAQALLCMTSCGGSPTEPTSSICFTVSGFNVSVSNLFRNGGAHHVDVQGLASFSETVSQNNETHSLQWTNIQNNYTTRTVDSFNVRIDGTNFSYPSARCR